MYSSGRLGGGSDDATTSAGSTAAADSEASPTAGGVATGGAGGTGGATSAAAASGGAGTGLGGTATGAAGSSKEAVSGIAAAVSGGAATTASGGGGAGATATKAATGGGEEKTAEAPKPTTSTLDTATLPIFTAVVGVRNPTTTAEPAAATAPTTVSILMVVGQAPSSHLYAAFGLCRLTIGQHHLRLLPRLLHPVQALCTSTSAITTRSTSRSRISSATQASSSPTGMSPLIPSVTATRRTTWLWWMANCTFVTSPVHARQGDAQADSVVRPCSSLSPSPTTALRRPVAPKSTTKRATLATASSLPELG